MDHLVRHASSALLIAVGLAASGCEAEKTVPAVDPAASGSAAVDPKKPALGGKLAEAVKAAESAAPPSAGKPGEGPPEKGVFAPGAADAVMKLGQPAKIELLGEGSDPKITLALAPGDGEQKVAASVAFRSQGRGLPVDYTLAVKVDKPKDKAKAKDEPKADDAGLIKVVATVVSLSLPPQLPKEAQDQISKLKGSELRWKVTPQGMISDPSVTTAKGAEAGLDQLLKQVHDALAVVAVPLPSKPVGAGAYWMVTDRVASGGIDAVRYRVYRVEKVEKDKATLSVDIRQYAAKNEIEAGEGQKVNIDVFESLGKAKTEWSAQGLLPTRSEAQIHSALRTSAGQPAQVELNVKVASSEPDKADKKK